MVEEQKLCIVNPLVKSLAVNPPYELQKIQDESEEFSIECR